jgi:hypothetical protein
MTTTDHHLEMRAASTQNPKSCRTHWSLGIEPDVRLNTWYKTWLGEIAWRVRRAFASDRIAAIVCKSRRVLAELRTCWQRMRIECKRPVGLDPSLCLGPMSIVDSAGHLKPCNRSQCCSRDTEALQADYPWATDFDLRVFLRGWRAGAEWGTASQADEPSVGSCSEQPEHIRARTA